jgi:hypothetical protein
VALGSHMEERSEDAAAQLCSMVVGSRSRTMSRLPEGGRQSVMPVGPKGCLDRIL